MEETFSPSHDMAEYMSGYWKWGKLLGNKTLVRTWTVIGESGLAQLLRNLNDKKTQHQSKGSNFKQTKPIGHVWYAGLSRINFVLELGLI